MADPNVAPDPIKPDQADIDLEELDTDIPDSPDTSTDDWRKTEEERLRQMTPDELIAEALAKEQSKRRLFARVKKQPKAKVETPPPTAEVKPQPITKAESPPPTDSVTPEDLLRTTKGYDDDALKELKAIAKGKGISLINAQNDPLFVAYLEKQEAEKKKRAAQLKASTGSGSTKSQEYPKTRIIYGDTVGSVTRSKS